MDIKCYPSYEMWTLRYRGINASCPSPFMAITDQDCVIQLTEGVNIYTHSEMLPAHGYPHLKKYEHLKGNIGKSWFDQRQLFEAFPGAILGTTNCVMPIKGSYSDRFWSYDVAGLEGMPGALRVSQCSRQVISYEECSLPSRIIHNTRDTI